MGHLTTLAKPHAPAGHWHHQEWAGKRAAGLSPKGLLKNRQLYDIQEALHLSFQQFCTPGFWSAEAGWSLGPQSTVQVYLWTSCKELGMPLWSVNDQLIASSSNHSVQQWSSAQHFDFQTIRCSLPKVSCLCLERSPGNSCPRKALRTGGWELGRWKQPSLASRVSYKNLVQSWNIHRRV